MNQDLNNPFAKALQGTVSMAGGVASFPRNDFAYELKPGLELAMERIHSLPDNVARHIAKLVEQITLPPHWIKEGITPPSSACQNKTIEICERLFREHEILPLLVASSKVGGIYAKYNIETFDLRIEIDNDLDCVAVASHGKQVVASSYLGQGHLEEEGLFFAILKNSAKIST